MSPKRKKKTGKRGGRREGAGRKPLHPEGVTERVGVSVPARLVAALDEFAASRQISAVNGNSRPMTRSEAVAEALRKLLGL